MSSVLPLVVVMMAAGYGLRRLGLVHSAAAQDFNNLVFYITLPPLIFVALHKASLSWSLLVMPAIAWGLVALGSALGVLLARSMRLPREAAGALVLAMVFGNTTFFGYPVVEGFYGSRGLTLAIFYDLLGATVATQTVGTFLASSFGNGDRARVRALLARILTFPAIWALALGLALHGLGIPPHAEALLSRTGALTAPLVMFSIGLEVRFEDWRQDLPLAGLAALTRLVVLPALVFAALTALGLDPP